MKFVVLIVFILIFGIDTACQFVLDKTIPNYKSIWCMVPGYNIYQYIKWRKEFKQ